MGIDHQLARLDDMHENSDIPLNGVFIINGLPGRESPFQRTFQFQEIGQMDFLELIGDIRFMGSMGTAQDYDFPMHSNELQYIFQNGG